MYSRTSGSKHGTRKHVLYSFGSSELSIAPPPAHTLHQTAIRPLQERNILAQAKNQNAFEGMFSGAIFNGPVTITFK